MFGESSKPSEQASQFLKYVQGWNRRKISDESPATCVDLLENGRLALVCPPNNAVTLPQLTRELCNLTASDDVWSTLVGSAKGFETSLEQYSPVGCFSGPHSTESGISAATETAGPRRANFATSLLVLATHADNKTPLLSVLVTSFNAKNTRKNSPSVFGVYAYSAEFYGILVGSVRENTPKEVQEKYTRFVQTGLAVRLDDDKLTEQEIINSVAAMATKTKMLWTNFNSPKNDIYNEQHIQHQADAAWKVWTSFAKANNDDVVDWSTSWEYVVTRPKQKQQQAARNISEEPKPKPSPAAAREEPKPSPARDVSMLSQQKRRKIAVVEKEEDEEDESEYIVKTSVITTIPTGFAECPLHGAFLRSSMRVIKKDKMDFPTCVIDAITSGNLIQTAATMFSNREMLGHKEREYGDKFLSVVKTLFDVDVMSGGVA
jgi:hypothetical protein